MIISKTSLVDYRLWIFTTKRADRTAVLPPPIGVRFQFSLEAPRVGRRRRRRRRRPIE